jgi:hypothetical protein
MNFKYIGVIEVVDHVLSSEINQGAKIKINNKKMLYNQIIKADDVITVNDKKVAERLRLSGVYTEIKDKKINNKGD